MTRGHLLLVGLTAFLTACGSDPTASSPEDPEFVELLYGAWSWVSSEGGIAGVRRTPESEGYTQTLVLSSPNRAELFRAGASVASTTFEFVPALDLVDEYLEARIRYADPIFGWDEQIVRFDAVENLVLVDPCCDGFVHTFGPSGGG
jgi:hypothetical protein